MNYEQKYKEALERAKKHHDNPNASNVRKEWIEDIFPELRESEDERIRKEIIQSIQDNMCVIHKDKCLAWLEKQCEQKPVNKVESKFKVGDWILYQRTESSREVLQIYDIRDGRYYFNDMCHFSWSIKECDEKSHLWTIKDAKDGEVLAIGNEYFLFKEKKENTSQVVYISHCFADSAGAFRVTNGRDCGEFLSIENGVKACPATKEQRDFLFQKMKETGYEWDAEKKELKKIEQPSWSEEDEKMLKLSLENLTELKNNYGKEYGKVGDCIVWLKSLKPNHWKPSEQNIKDLEWCADLVKDKMGVGFHRLQVFMDEIKQL